MNTLQSILLGAVLMALACSVALNIYLVKDVRFVGLNGTTHDLMASLTVDGE